MHGNYYWLVENNNNKPLLLKLKIVFNHRSTIEKLDVFTPALFDSNSTKKTLVQTFWAGNIVWSAVTWTQIVGQSLKMSRCSTWSIEETEGFLDIWTDGHIKSILENTQKNAEALNTFSTRMREKEFDWSAVISMIVYFLIVFTVPSPPPYFFFTA